MLSDNKRGYEKSQRLPFYYERTIPSGNLTFTDLDSKINKSFYVKNYFFFRNEVQSIGDADFPIHLSPICQLKYRTLFSAELM